MATIESTMQIEAILGNIVTTAESSQKVGYQLASTRKTAKALRRKAVAQRLSKSLQADDPRLQLATLQAGRSAETAAALKQRVTRLKKRPTMGKNDWMVSGNVRYENGNAAGDLTIQVYDKDLKYDDLLGKTTTDEFGDFFIVYDITRFDDEWGNNKPDLYIRVLDKNGKVLAEKTEPLRVNAGNTEFFQVVISKSKIL